MSSEILLRKTIRLILESQGATTVRVDPTGVSPGFRPFGIVSGLAIDTGMTVLQSLDPSIVSVWADAGCAPDNNWPFKVTSAALNDAREIEKYADFLMEDVRDSAMSVIAQCAQLAQSIKQGSTLANTTTFAQARAFTLPATVNAVSSKVKADITPNRTGSKALSNIYSQLSSTPQSCNFDAYVGTLSGVPRSQLVAKIKAVAQAAFQGGQAQLDQHISKFLEPAYASIYKDIKVNNRNTTPVNYITSYKKTFVAESQSFISLIK